MIIETHISKIHIGKNVYKIKKPVKLTFLDFSTLELRKHYCEEEVRLNSRLSPDVYLGVVPVTEKGIGKRGTVIDYAVKMKKLENKMDELLRKNNVVINDINEIAKKVAEFHSQLKENGNCNPKVIISQIEDLSNYKKIIESACGKGDLVDEIVNWSKNEINKKKDIIESRKNKECHGDLHSGNIFLNPLRIIDCIEFSIEFRDIDPASEIAFFAMDLDSFGKKEFGELFVKKYISLTNDFDIISLLPLYKCYRANVRAKIAAIEYQENRRGAKSRMIKYLKLAKSYISV